MTYNSQVFHLLLQSKNGHLGGKPWVVIKVPVSMYMNVLDIIIESYGHVLGPPSFFLISEKIIFPAKLGHF